jgi:23S rRNA (guanosine2251-2'-O)-methyltransferase
MKNSRNYSDRKPTQRRVEKADDGPRQPKPSICGVLPVLEALRAENRRIERVLIAAGAKEHRFAQIIELCRERSIPFERPPKESFSKYVAVGANHQGVVAFTSASAYSSTDEILEHAADTALILILDGVEDPRNLGAILRVAECSGVDGVIIPERRAVGLTDTVAKSSAGALEYVKVAKAPNLNRFIEDLKEKNVWVVGTSVDAAMDYTQWDWKRPSALVLGGEGSGLHRLVAENCDVLVKIPMHGNIDSLNVSVAAGVILFEARRQRSLIR